MNQEEQGYTGEWIVRVRGIAGPDDARHLSDAIERAVLAEDFLGREVQVVFDASRWQGGDF